jgi:hypothetical protein
VAITSYRAAAPLPYSPGYSQYYPVEYFSGCDVSIFFGQEYIDQITGFEYGLSECIQPVYSYASYVPDEIVHGARLVQGRFMINLQPGDYLHEMLRPVLTTAANLTRPPTSQLTVQVNGGEEFPQPDPAIDPDGFREWAVTQRAIHWDQINALSDAGASAQIDAQPYFDNGGFSILLVYGDVDSVDITRNAGRIRTIENVHIYSVGQEIGLDGRNIMEKFEFMANDINKFNRLQDAH